MAAAAVNSMYLNRKAASGRPFSCAYWLEAADQEFALVDHLWGEMVVEGEEELFVAHDLLFPLRAVDGLEGVEGFAREVEALPVDVVEVRGPANGGFFAERAAADTVDDPLEDAHVFAVAGPEEAAVGGFAEPVDVEDAGRGREVALHLQPVTEVVAHVVAAEGQHGHGVTADLTDGAACCCGGFGAHGGADVDACRPVEGLVDQRQSS